MDGGRPEQSRVRGARRPNAPGDSHSADGGRRDRGRAGGAVRGIPAGDLPAPEGAGARRAHLAHPAGDRAAQSSRGRTAPRGDHLADELPAVLGREPRAARRVARGTARQGRPRQGGPGAGRRHTMSKTQITAEPGIPQITIEREFAAPRDLVLRTNTDNNKNGFHVVFHGEPSPDGLVQTFEYENMPGHGAMDTLTLLERDGRT